MVAIRRVPALTRRSVLRGIASGAAGLAVGPGCCGCGPQSDVVVIVGAGAAGIGAALALQEAGRPYQIFEAGSSVGGRAFTDMTTFATPFDVGCAWIHGDDDIFNNNSMMQTVDEWKRQRRWQSETFDKGDWDYHDCKELEFDEVSYGCVAEARVDRSKVKDDLQKAEKDFKAAIKAELEKRKPGDIPVGQVVKDWRWPMDVVASAMGPMDAGVDLYNLSAADSAATGNYAHNVLVKNGYGTVIRLLANGLPADRLHCNTRVTEIRSSGAGTVRVTTDRAGEVEAGAVIVTVSTGVLAHGDITFGDGDKDGLPKDHRHAIANLPMGLLAKVPLLVPNIGKMLESKNPPIKQFDNVISQRSDLQNIYFLVCPFNDNLVVGFVGGDFAWNLARKVPVVSQGEQPPRKAVEKVRKEAVDLVRQRLAGLVGCDLQIDPDNGYLTDWGWNPLTRGAYAAPKPGGFAARKTLRTPAFGRIYFAGEAVAEGGWHATCHGAYDSGQKVAKDVMAMLHHPA